MTRGRQGFRIVNVEEGDGLGGGEKQRAAGRQIQLVTRLHLINERKDKQVQED